MLFYDLKLCFRYILPIEGNIATEEPLEEYEDVYDEQHTEQVTETSQLDGTERFTEENKEDKTEPPKTKGGESRFYWPIYP